MLRWWMCALAIFGTALEARAADMPDFLRGSSTVINTTAPARWDGVYFGGHVGANVAGSDFAANLPFLAAVLDNTPVRTRTSSPLGNADSTGTHFGGFVGYQAQWDGAVI